MPLFSKCRVIRCSNEMSSLVTDLATITLQLLLKHRTVEVCARARKAERSYFQSDEDSNVVDSLLLGLLGLARTLVCCRNVLLCAHVALQVRVRVIRETAHTLPLLKFCYRRCLFDIPHEESPEGCLCKSSATRYCSSASSNSSSSGFSSHARLWSAEPLHMHCCLSCRRSSRCGADMTISPLAESACSIIRLATSQCWTR